MDQNIQKEKKIKLGFIAPTKYINSFGNQGDFQLGLSCLMDCDSVNLYEQALLDTKQDIVLDNGNFENHIPENTDSLISKALKIKADSFFAPDFLYDRQKTEESFEQTYFYLKQKNLQDILKINVVIQANNPKDYIESYKKFAEDNRVNLIGLSILAIPESFKNTTQTNDITINRIECLNQLNQLDIHRNSHLLGLGSSLKDVVFAKNNCDWVVSHDSSSSFWNGLQGKKILDNGDVEGGKTSIKVDFNYDKPLSKEQEEIIQSNINKVKELIK